MRDWTHVFVVMRFDPMPVPLDRDNITFIVKAKEVLWTAEAAEREADRLNLLAAGESKYYFVQVAKLIGAEPERSGEDRDEP